MDKIKFKKRKIKMMIMTNTNFKIKVRIDKKINQVQLVNILHIPEADGIRIIDLNMTFQIMITLIKLMKSKSKTKNIYKILKD